MAMLGLLHILDHPQAPNIIHRMISTRPRRTAVQDHVLEDSSSDCSPPICSHCSSVTQIMCTEPPGSNTHHTTAEWSLHTLHRIIHMGSLTDGLAKLMSGLSTTALCNLLVLLELNVKSLPHDTLGRFVSNVEELSCTKKEEWCGFLVQRLKRHVCTDAADTAADEQPLLLEQSCDSVSSVELSCDEAECVSSVAMRDVEEPSSPQAELTDPKELGSPFLPAPKSDVKADDEHEVDGRSLMADIYHEWSLAKPADQTCFNSFCCVSNAKFVKNLSDFTVNLPETSIAAISTNISSLPSEMSFHKAVRFMHTVILPMVVRLKQSASREMVSGLCHINKLYPIPMVRGFVEPLLRHTAFGTVQSNLLVRVLEESANQEQLDSVWRCLADIQVDSNGAPYLWTEDVVFLSLALFQRGVATTEASISQLISTLQRNATALSKSSKFANLVIKVCKYLQSQGMGTKFHTELTELASLHTGLMKQAMIREVKRLSC